MSAENDFLNVEWPDGLRRVDMVEARFVLDFSSPCRVRPADFLGLGRVLRVAARHWPDPRERAASRQWEALLQPMPSDDPVARRRFQKPAPAFVVSMPLQREKLLDSGDRLELEVLFLGTGIPLIGDFLCSLMQLGRLGLVAGDGCFEVTAVYSRQSGADESLAWRQSQPVEALTLAVQPLSWLLEQQSIPSQVKLNFLTPTRLIVDGKPLRQPRFTQIFPFMLRRVTSMLYAHGGIEVLDDPLPLLEYARALDVPATRLAWQDWRAVARGQGLLIGGFVGEMQLAGHALGELYWVLALAARFGIGKGATYGAGHFAVSCLPSKCLL